MHDLIAELQGYRNELTSAKRNGRDDRAEAVRGEIERVTGDIKATAERLLATAEEHDNVGQHTLGAQLRAEATRLRRAVGVDDQPAAETAADSTPRQRAVSKKASR